MCEENESENFWKKAGTNSKYNIMRKKCRKELWKIKKGERKECRQNRKKGLPKIGGQIDSEYQKQCKTNDRTIKVKFRRSKISLITII